MGRPEISIEQYFVSAECCLAVCRQHADYTNASEATSLTGGDPFSLPTILSTIADAEAAVVKPRSTKKGSCLSLSTSRLAWHPGPEICLP
eukprot:scaffold66444_cov18-Tisochrysis_lutea.AAC.2